MNWNWKVARSIFNSDLKAPNKEKKKRRRKVHLHRAVHVIAAAPGLALIAGIFFFVLFFSTTFLAPGLWQQIRHRKQTLALIWDQCNCRPLVKEKDAQSAYSTDLKTAERGSPKGPGHSCFHVTGYICRL